MKTILTPKEKEMAFTLWYQSYGHRKYDRDVGPFLNSNLPASDSKSWTWIERTRKAKFHSIQFVADRLRISKQAFHQLERSEQAGTISLQNLAKLADVLDCELIYALRPKSKLQFSQQIWKVLLEKAVEHPWLPQSTLTQRYRSVLRFVRQLESDPEFRTQNGWTKLKRNRGNCDLR